MKTTLTVLTLLVLLVVACGKDGDTPVENATPEVAETPEVVQRPVAIQDTPAAVPRIETPATVVAVSTVVPTPQVTGTRLEVESVSGTVGRNATAEIMMRDATEGLSGFKIEVSVSDPDVARIVGVDLSGFGLRDVGPLPATVLSITAVDLSRNFEGPFERRTIATLDLDLLTAGETAINLRVLLLDDDRGDPVSAKAVHGRLTVSEAGASP